jgi:protein gp37
MSAGSKIEWTDATWNPVTGCTELSPGCANCFAKRFAERFRGVPGHHFEHGFDVQLRPEVLEWPSHYRGPRGLGRPARVFVCSMSDLFHHAVPDGFIGQVWNRMCQEPHVFQILTKRPERMRDWLTRWYDTKGDAAVDAYKGQGRDRGPAATRAKYASGRAELFAQMLESMGEPPAGMAYPTYDWIMGQRYWSQPGNVWVGTSIENDRFAYRADILRETPAAVRFISAEPLLGPLPSLNLRGIDWLIVGGESGPGARPMHPDWVRDLRDRAWAAGAAFFFKQWGEWAPRRAGLAPSTLRAALHAGYVRLDGKFTEDESLLASDPEPIWRVGKHAAGRELDGLTWDEFPR